MNCLARSNQFNELKSIDPVRQAIMNVNIIKSPLQIQQEKIAEALKNNAQKPQYLNNNDPRTGFLYHPIAHKMGQWFQKTIKNTVIENAINIAWKGMIKYRCGGDKKAIREANNNPDTVYSFPDPFINTLDTLAKETIREFHTDNDQERKQNILFKCIDMFSFGLNEDIYYRARTKLQLKMAIEYFINNPEAFALLELTEDEQRNVGMWNDYGKTELYGNAREL